MIKKTNTRLTDEEATSIGLRVTPSGQYRVTKEQLFDIKSERLGTKTNQYEPKPIRDIMTALNEKGEVMDIDEYCEFYNIPRDQVRSYKLVSHTGTPFYNVASGNVEERTSEDIMSIVESYIEQHKPDYSFIKDLPKDSKNLLVLDIADLHIGKLSRAYETNDEYNTEIAKQRAIEGISGILSKASSFEIDRIMFVIGNDIMHSDNAKSTTTSGTYQDSVGMFYDMFNEALDTYVKIIESLITKYKVDIVFNPSNHDYASGWMLARTVSAWFRNSPNVTIDDTINHRKYYQYGKNMIGTNHGDGAKLADLPLLMANEQPQMWADTTYRYIYNHHIHHKQVTKFQSAKDFIGVTIEHLRSPSGSDSWHHRNGYTAKKAIEGFIHNYEDGQIARITHYFS